eukprot:Awhi_evm1s8617
MYWLPVIFIGFITEFAFVIGFPSLDLDERIGDVHSDMNELDNQIMLEMTEKVLSVREVLIQIASIA